METYKVIYEMGAYCGEMLVDADSYGEAEHKAYEANTCDRFGKPCKRLQDKWHCVAVTTTYPVKNRQRTLKAVQTTGNPDLFVLTYNGKLEGNKEGNTKLQANSLAAITRYTRIRFIFTDHSEKIVAVGK